MSSEFIQKEFVSGYPSGPPHDDLPYAYAIQRALAMYRSVHYSARMGMMWARLRKKQFTLLSMPALGSTVNMHTLGILPVPICQIRGSEGRSSDFDAAFRPLFRHTRQRWVQIASLIIMGIYLPAVELIQIGDDYFVRDGNHRISVMRSMGVQFIDSRVIEVTNYMPEIDEAQAIACAPELELS